MSTTLSYEGCSDITVRDERVPHFVRAGWTVKETPPPPDPADKPSRHRRKPRSDAAAAPAEAEPTEQKED